MGAHAHGPHVRLELPSSWGDVNIPSMVLPFREGHLTVTVRYLVGMRPVFSYASVMLLLLTWVDGGLSGVDPVQA